MPIPDAEVAHLNQLAIKYEAECKAVAAAGGRVQPRLVQYSMLPPSEPQHVDLSVDSDASPSPPRFVKKKEVQGGGGGDGGAIPPPEDDQGDHEEKKKKKPEPKKEKGKTTARNRLMVCM